MSDVTSTPIDWASVKDELTGILTEGLEGLVSGAAGDVQQFAASIAMDTTKAMQLPAAQRDPLLRELAGQVKLVAELNRIRAVNEGWETVRRVVEVAQRTAVLFFAGIA